MLPLQKRMRPLLGCFVEVAISITATAVTDSSQLAFDAAFARIQLIQNLLSFHDLASDLSRLNRANGEWVNCHPFSIRCLRLARAVTKASAGHFNCTLGASLTTRGALPQHDFQNI